MFSCSRFSPRPSASIQYECPHYYINIIYKPFHLPSALFNHKLTILVRGTLSYSIYIVTKINKIFEIDTCIYICPKVAKYAVNLALY